MPSLKSYSAGLPYSYAAGVFPCMELLRTGPERARLLLVSQRAEGDGIRALREMCRLKGIREEIADKALARISGKQNCYAALVFDKWLSVLRETKPHVVLHHPMDEGNLGTILRTLLGFGILDVAVIRPSADLFEPRVIRASMGAVFSLNARSYEDFSEYREAYPAHAMYPFMLDGAVSLEQAARNIQRPYALIFGNEGKGLPSGFARLGQTVRIPHSGDIDSLNLAVAVAIGAYAFTRQNGSRVK